MINEDTPRNNIVRDSCKGMPWREAFKRLSNFSDDTERELNAANARVKELEKRKGSIMSKKLKGKISLSRYTSNVRPDGVTISLIDESSGVQCVEIEISIETLGYIITGLSHQECTFEWRPDFVGMIRENKTEIIPFTATNYKTRDQESAAALAPYEVDGWKGSITDMTNGHCRTPSGQRVGFRRFVPAPKEEQP